MKYNISLGIDIGTSKISVAYYCKNTGHLNLVLVADIESFFPDKYGEYVEPSTAVFTEEEYPFFGREGEIKVRDGLAKLAIHSIKKCVFCEWFYQAGQKHIQENHCKSFKNYENKDWCNRGSLDFTIGSYDWKPSALFQQLINYVFSKTASKLEQEFPDYNITELKLAFPMIFYEGGPFYEEKLKSLIKSMAQVTFGPCLDEICKVLVIEEPIACLMAYCGDDFRGLLADGYFLIIDIGAGTTDVALCLKKNQKVCTMYTRSITVAGDEYDDAIKKLIRERLSQDYQLNNINEISKQVKEDFCRTGLIHTKDLIGQRVKIKKTDIMKEFKRINSKILKEVRNIRQHLLERDLDLNEILLTGGGSNNSSIRDGIEDLAKQGRIIPVKTLILSDSSLNTMYDSKIVGVSLGAALPQRNYLRLIKYSLPVNILLLYRDQEGNEKTLTIYKADAERSRSTTQLKSFEFGASAKLLVESRQGTREILNSFSIPQVKGKKKLTSVSLSYDVQFNGKTSVLVKFRYKGMTGGIKEKQIEIFNSYPHWKLRKQLV